MSDEDGEKEGPRLKVVSENPGARVDREVAYAKETAQAALSQFAATLLRTIAGSESEASYLISAASRFHRCSEGVERHIGLLAISSRTA